MKPREIDVYIEELGVARISALGSMADRRRD